MLTIRGPVDPLNRQRQHGVQVLQSVAAVERHNTLRRAIAPQSVFKRNRHKFTARAKLDTRDAAVRGKRNCVKGYPRGQGIKHTEATIANHNGEITVWADIEALYVAVAARERNIAFPL